MKKFFLFAAAALMAFAACEQNPVDNGGIIDDNGGNGGQTETVASLNGSNYYPILMDAVTFEKIQSKVAADLRAQDGGDENSTRPLYIWNGYDGAESAGLNFYGNAEGFTCFSVNGAGGWSGFGIFLKKTDAGFAKMADLAKGGYYLHFAYRGPAGVSHCLYPAWGGKEYRVSIGDGAKFEDGGVAYDFVAPISNGGKFIANEWNEYEIALSDTGLDFTAPAAEEGGQNIFCGLSGGVAGTLLQIDAVFFYKK
jgi:hypothetical protein